MALADDAIRDVSAGLDPAYNIWRPSCDHPLMPEPAKSLTKKLLPVLRLYFDLRSVPNDRLKADINSMGQCTT